MFHLPPSSHSARDLFDVETDLVPLGTGERQAPTLRDAVYSAKRTIAGDAAINAVFSIAMTANDDIVLLRVGSRGAVKTIWNFSKG